MKGKSDDSWLPILGGIMVFTWVIPIMTGVIFPEIPPSPCVESITVECDEWSPACNINITVEEVSGPYYNQKTDYIETYNREVCIEYENGTRVLP